MLNALGQTGYYMGSRDIGDREPLPRRQPECTEYRGREMGEDPAKVPTREQQQAYYNQSQTGVNSARTERTDYRPREMGEAPAEREKQQEMTEQERRLDLFA